MMTWIKNLFKRKPVHERELYVLKNAIAFVRCKRCGMQSMPWRVRPDQAKEYNERHPEMYTELDEIDKTKVSDACRSEWL